MAHDIADNSSRNKSLLIPSPIRELVVFIARITPTRVSAWSVQRFLPPHTAASLAPDLPPDRAASIVEYLSTDYLLQTLRWVDANNFGPLLKSISPQTAGRLAKSLADQREFTEMSALVAYLSPEAMVAAVKVFHSGHDLLKAASLIKEKHLLSPAILSIPAKKLPGLFSAADSAGLWREIFSIVDAMNADTQDQLGLRLAELGRNEITSFLRASLRLNTWPQLLEICLRIQPGAQSNLAALIAMQDETLHLGFMRSAQEQGKMQLLLKLVSCMPMDDQRRLVRMAGRNGIRITSVL